MYYLHNLSSDFVDKYHFLHEKFNMSSTITCVKYVNNRCPTKLQSNRAIFYYSLNLKKGHKIGDDFYSKYNFKIIQQGFTAILF